MNAVWDIKEAERFINLAYAYPYLLTHDEEVLFEELKGYGFLWMTKDDIKKYGSVSKENYKFLTLRKLESIWLKLKQKVSGEENHNISILKKIADEAEEIPF